MADPNSIPTPTYPAIPVYSHYQFTQMRDVIVPLMLVAPSDMMRQINHDVRQLFCNSGDALFGNKRRGWLIQDYAEFITDVKLGRYTPQDPLFADMPRMARLWHGSGAKVTTLAELAEEQLTKPPHAMLRAFETEFALWLSYVDKTRDYDEAAS